MPLKSGSSLELTPLTRTPEVSDLPPIFDNAVRRRINVEPDDVVQLVDEFVTLLHILNFTERQMTKFTFHHNIPILRRLYLQRDEARNQREAALRELDVTRSQRDEVLRELREIRDNIYREFSSSQFIHSVPEPKFVPHSKWMSYLSNSFNRPGVRILEIGSRNVTGGRHQAAILQRALRWI